MAKPRLTDAAGAAAELFQDDIMVTRAVALTIDLAFSGQFAAGVASYYRTKDRLPTADDDEVYQVDHLDPITRFPPGHDLSAPEDTDLARTPHLSLAPPETGHADVRISFRLLDCGEFILNGAANVAVVQPYAGPHDFRVRVAGEPLRTRDTQEFAARVERLLELARAEGSHVAVLPEISATERVLNQLALTTVDLPNLVAAGSRYVSHPSMPGIFENVADLLSFAPSMTVPRGTTLRAARKSRPALGEPIRDTSDNPRLQLFQVGNCKVTVVICADFVEGRVLALLRALGVELILVPSLTLPSTSVRTHFAEPAAPLVDRTGGAVVNANSPHPRRRSYDFAGAIVAGSRNDKTTLLSAPKNDAGDIRPGIALRRFESPVATWHHRRGPEITHREVTNR